MDDASETIDWIYANHAKHDLRMAYIECKDGKLQQPFEWAPCDIDLISPYSARPYCYSTEASNYA